jgi:hypothetical protein
LETSDSFSGYGCGFELVYAVDFTLTGWFYLDGDGNLVRYREHIATRTQTWTNPLNGRVLGSTGGSYTFEWNPDQPTVDTYVGRMVLLTVPREGVVALDVGRVQRTGMEPPYEFPFVAGHHDLFFGPLNGAPWPEAFCAYMAG